jgi:hypothetical protein
MMSLAIDSMDAADGTCVGIGLVGEGRATRSSVSENGREREETVDTRTE